MEPSEEPKTAQQRQNAVLKSLREFGAPISYNDLAALLGWSPRDTNSALSHLAARAGTHVYRIGRGIYEYNGNRHDASGRIYTRRKKTVASAVKAVQPTLPTLGSGSDGVWKFRWVTTDATGAQILQDEHKDLWRAVKI